MARVIDLYPERQAYQLTLSLDGVSFVLDIEWRVRARAWYFGWYALDGTPLWVGRRANLGVNLTPANVDGLPAGGFFIYRMDARFDDPGELDLGGVARLFYLSSEEVEQTAIPPRDVALSVAVLG